MTKLNNIMILGVGAVGAIVAGKLADAGYTVDILCDAERKARYTKDNFIINGKPYVFNYVTKEEVTTPPDFLIVATKHYALKEAIAGFQKIVGQHTLVMSLLNGTDSEAIIGDVVGREKMIPAFIVKTDSTKTGNSTVYASSGVIHFGEADKSKTQRLDDIAALFSAIGMDYQIEEDILKEQWWKYMLNIGMNQVSAVMGATYGVFHTNADIRQLASKAMHEAVLVAKAKGIALNDAMIPGVFEVIDKLAPEGMTSMMQDVSAGRKTEADMLAGQLIALGKEYGIPTPVNEVLYLQLKIIEAMSGVA
ncbi:MAG: ketopantoate reductase family protein [Eubacteriales bacterium]